MNKTLSPIEKLLEEYMVGAISHETYRSERSKVIEQLTQEVFQRDVTIPKSSITSNPKPAVTSNTDSHFQVPTIQKNNSTENSKTLQYIIIVVLLVGGGLSWYFSKNQFQNPIEVHHPLADKTLLSEKKHTLDEPFIAAFNEKADWNTEVISDFLVQWQSLTSSQQNMARQSSSFIKLDQILRKRIGQQRMISNNKEKKTSRRESLLIWFASQLSIGIN